MKIRLWNIISHFFATSLILLLFGCHSEGKSNEDESVLRETIISDHEIEIFCPFGICMGDTIDSIPMNEALRSSHVDKYSSSIVLPPKPFFQGESNTGNLFEGVDYNVLYSAQTGVCAVSMYGALKKESLKRYYSLVSKYLNIELSKVIKVRDDLQLIYASKGSNLEILNEIEDIYLFEFEYDLFPRYAISLEFWYNNYDECIKYQPEIAKLKYSVN